ncbi:MAG: hypothetical protein DCF15_06110 [Phormidesmis priestleyi]|uniref:Lipoprotein n=1 Tax=Phormidesmis priestleyi TaxID=268141 RepID=A0A2W4XU54_9CYAN|nr:MAG: hypothetical protein DCF15_06110 [Phormidesmis priestleyi]
MQKKLKSAELFLSLGLATTLFACARPSADISGDNGEAANAPTEKVMDEGQTSHSGGEGDEGGEGSASGDPDVDYMTTLALMKGHLLVAEELVAAGNYKEAEPHIGHPVEELYGGIEEQLAARKVTDFKADLNQLSDLSKSAPDSAEMKTQFAKALAGIDGAIAAIPDTQRQSPDFVMAVIINSLNTAAEEYKAAIADNKFVEIVEYQDSKGFVEYSEQLYQTISDQMSASNPQAHATITQNLAELKTAWPSIQPPAAPIKSPEEVDSLVSEIELSQ